MEHQPNDNNPHLLSPNKQQIASNDQQDAHMNEAEAPRLWIQMEITSSYKCIKASLPTKVTLKIFPIKTKIKPTHLTINKQLMRLI